MAYLFYIIFGLAPSAIWLLFYLRQDAHPEPNRLILKIFFLGAGSAILAAFLEMGFFEVTKVLGFSPFFLTLINIFLGVALIEETLKYVVVKCYALRSPELDEPVDAMLYMIIAALGFAALENTLILWFNQRPFYFLETLTWSAVRFLGATFLHALCSGLVGYFLALSCFKKGNKRIRGCSPVKYAVPLGLTLGILLHGFYNFSIMKLGGSQKMLLPIIILIGSAIFVSFGFKHLTKLSTPTKNSSG